MVGSNRRPGTKWTNVATTDAKPILAVIAGPNGSGKTTLTRQLIADGANFGEYINPDDIALTISGDMAVRTRAAQAEADARRAACLESARSFSFETVMSHPSKLRVMREARDRGFLVRLFFVSLTDPKLNVGRVALRVREGGHDVPTDRIISRYERTMTLLPEAFAIAEQALAFDNSDDDLERAMRLIVVKDHARLLQLPPVPDWVHERLVSKLGV
jgi:predicted ABC-type ATPase